MTTSSAEADAATPAVTISFAAADINRPMYQPLIDAFNAQNRDIRVEFVASGDIFQRLGKDPTSSEELAHGVLTAADTADFVPDANSIENGYVLDLQPLIDADATFDRSGFYPGALAAARVGTGTYLLPHTLNVPLLAYNKDLFARRGIAPPTENWTWRDLTATAGRLAQQRDGQIATYGLLERNDGGLALSAELAQADAALLTAPIDDVQLDQPAAKGAVQQVVALADAGAIFLRPRTMPMVDPDMMQQLILDQKVAMWTPELLYLGSRVPNPAFAIGTAPLPVPLLLNGPYIEGYVISSGTQQPQAAWRWLSFLSRQPIDRSISIEQGSSATPARLSVAEASGYWTGLDSETATAVQASLRQLPQHARNAVDAQLIVPLYHILDSVVRKEQPIERALSDAQAMLEAQLAEERLMPQPTANAQPIVVATPVPELEPGVRTVVRFKAFAFDARSLQPIADAFNQANPELFIQVESLDTPDGNVQFSDAAAQTDCFAWSAPPTAAETPATFDLQPLVDADPLFRLADYPRAMLAPFRRGLGLYGLPSTVNFRVLAYNRTAFDAAGMAYPNAGWSVDDLRAAAQQLTSKDDDLQRYGFASLAAQRDDLAYFLRQFAATPATGRNKNIQPRFTDPAVIQTVRLYVDLLRSASPYQNIQGYTPNQEADAVPNFISEGQVNIWFSFDASPNFGTTNQTFRPAVAPPPLSSRTLSEFDMSVSGLHISATTQHPDACWSWLKYLSAEVGWLQGRFPARRSVAESDAFAQQALPGAIDVYRAYEQALAGGSVLQNAPGSLFPPPIDYFWFFRAIDRALQGKNVEQELGEAQALTERYLQCVRGNPRPGSCARQIDPTYEGLSTPF